MTPALPGPLGHRRGRMHSELTRAAVLDELSARQRRRRKAREPHLRSRPRARAVLDTARHPLQPALAHPPRPLAGLESEEQLILA